MTATCLGMLCDIPEIIIEEAETTKRLLTQKSMDVRETENTL